MKLWIEPGAWRPGCAEDPPSDDGDQNDKQRSCFWRFMELGEWGGMISDFCSDCDQPGESVEAMPRLMATSPSAGGE
jgi:hypothetical protein